MLTKKRQRKYINKVKKEAVEQLKKIASSSSPEDLHKFRVCVKKIKSFSSFLDLSKGKKYVKPLKKVFKETGNVRDAGNANKVEEDHFKLSDQIKNKRKTEYDSVYKKFLSHAKKYPGSFDKTKKKLNKKISKIPSRSIQEYFQEELSKIPYCLAQDDDELIHSGRKHLKNLLYLYKILPSSSQKKLDLQIDYVDKLQDKIGKWHDLVLALPLLKKKVSAAQLLIIGKEKENLLDETRKLGENFFDKIKIHGR